MCKQRAAIFYVDYSLKHSRLYVNDKAGYKVLTNFSGTQKYHFNESKCYYVMRYYFVIYRPRFIHKNFTRSTVPKANVRYNIYNFLDNTHEILIN